MKPVLLVVYTEDRKLNSKANSSFNIRRKRIFVSILFLFISSFFIFISCARKSPSDVNNVCSIFDEKWFWHRNAKKASKKWGTPVHVLMAILYQESRFKYDAKPERNKLLGFIPWTRKSSAYGYAQVLDETWEQYIDESGNSGADRDSFKDAIDFVGWYTFKTHKITGVSKWDAYNQYLAYHEGQVGYKKNTFKSKKWLIKVAGKVDERAKYYSKQLKECS